MCGSVTVSEGESSDTAEAEGWLAKGGAATCLRFWRQLYISSDVVLVG